MRKLDALERRMQMQAEEKAEKAAKRAAQAGGGKGGTEPGQERPQLLLPAPPPTPWLRGLSDE